MTTFVALYRGETVSSARLVAVSSEPGLVAEVSRRILNDPLGPDSEPTDDPVIKALDRGKRSALRSIYREAQAPKNE